MGKDTNNSKSISSSIEKSLSVYYVTYKWVNDYGETRKEGCITLTIDKQPSTLDEGTDVVTKSKKHVLEFDDQSRKYTLFITGIFRL